MEQLWDQVSGGEHRSCRGQDVHSMLFFLSGLGVGERRWLLEFFVGFVELLPLGFSVIVSVVHQRPALSENRNVATKKGVVVQLLMQRDKVALHCGCGDDFVTGGFAYWQ